MNAATRTWKHSALPSLSLHFAASLFAKTLCHNLRSRCGPWNKSFYVIVSCSILKEPYIRQFGKFNDIYGQSLSFVLERAIFCIDNQCPNGQGKISAIVERRGKREDKNLMSYYQQLLEKGTYWVTAERMKNRMLCLDFKWKSEDIAGLQIADLIAYPLTRHVLNPQAVNLAYDVLEPNIFMEDGKLMGLKIYPSQQA